MEWKTPDGMMHFRFKRPLPKIAWTAEEFDGSLTPFGSPIKTPFVTWKDCLLLAGFVAGALAVFFLTGTLACWFWQAFSKVVAIYG